MSTNALFARSSAPNFACNYANIMGETLLTNILLTLLFVGLCISLPLIHIKLSKAVLTLKENAETDKYS